MKRHPAGRLIRRVTCLSNGFHCRTDERRVTKFQRFHRDDRAFGTDGYQHIDPTSGDHRPINRSRKYRHRHLQALGSFFQNIRFRSSRLGLAWRIENLWLFGNFRYNGGLWRFELCDPLRNRLLDLRRR